MSDSVWPHRQQPTRLPRPWDSPGKNTGVGCHFLLQCMKMKSESEVTQSCPTLSNTMDCSPPASSIHGIFQARILEWGAIAFSLRIFLKTELNFQCPQNFAMLLKGKNCIFPKWLFFPRLFMISCEHNNTRHSRRDHFTIVQKLVAKFLYSGNGFLRI